MLSKLPSELKRRISEYLGVQEIRVQFCCSTATNAQIFIKGEFVKEIDTISWAVGRYAKFFVPIHKELYERDLFYWDRGRFYQLVTVNAKLLFGPTFDYFVSE